tara:strand:+ start:607 stop:1263 length:657 start_codon:yes stop_codon:yes gene_type:complete
LLVQVIVIEKIRGRASDQVVVEYSQVNTSGKSDKIQFPAETALKYSIRRQLVLTESDWESIKTEAIGLQAKIKAFSLVAQRERTAFELTKALKSTKRFRFTDQMIEVAVARVEELGYLDHDKIARHHVTRSSSTLKSKRLLRYQMKGRGISDSAIETSLDNYDEMPAALIHIQKKHDITDRNSFSPGQLDQVKQHLYRKGFQTATIELCLQTLTKSNF